MDLDTATGVRSFVLALTNLAIEHHNKNVRAIPTGSRLMEIIDPETSRNGHRKLASTIYRKVRWSLAVGAGDTDDARRY